MLFRLSREVNKVAVSSDSLTVSTIDDILLALTNNQNGGRQTGREWDEV